MKVLVESVQTKAASISYALSVLDHSNGKVSVWLKAPNGNRECLANNTTPALALSTLHSFELGMKFAQLQSIAPDTIAIRKHALTQFNKLAEELKITRL